jgi:hypothetical protein|nr:MAG: Hydrogenase/urease nickel incorporation, metallochaperone, hypA [Bacteriophage sp.]
MTHSESADIIEEILRLNPRLGQKDHPAIEAMKVALTALRPVSRERVERVWYRRGWKYDNLRADGGIVYSATNTCMYCGSETPIGNFCYRCGIAQTDMGVDVVLERLEALYGDR